MEYPSSLSVLIFKIPLECDPIYEGKSLLLFITGLIIYLAWMTRAKGGGGGQLLQQLGSS